MDPGEWKNTIYVGIKNGVNRRKLSLDSRSVPTFVSQLTSPHFKGPVMLLHKTSNLVDRKFVFEPYPNPKYSPLGPKKSKPTSKLSKNQKSELK